MRLILASQSRARRDMLAAAGLEFEHAPSGIDEVSLRSALDARGQRPDPAAVAVHLARAKAEAVSRNHPDATVVGADQVLVLGDEILEKSSDLSAARAALSRLRGREHTLHSAVAIAAGGVVAWDHCSSARLAMRSFSDRLLDEYLAAAGERILGSVGAYEIEGWGVQLFERIEGDHFVILGMPLLPLMEALRQRGAIGS